jgi:hypothetical protein
MVTRTRLDVTFIRAVLVLRYDKNRGGGMISLTWQTGFIKQTGIVSVRGSSLIDSMSYHVYNSTEDRGRSGYLILNAHAQNEDKSEDTKDGFYKQLECAVHQFRKHHTKIY